MQKKTKDLTAQQIEYIVSLRLYERAVGEGGNRKSVTKKFWAKLLDKTWQTANTNQLKGLVKKGWLKSIVGGNNTAFYSLTRKAVRASDELIHAAHQYEWDAEQTSFLSEEYEQELDGGLG